MLKIIPINRCQFLKTRNAIYEYGIMKHKKDINSGIEQIHAKFLQYCGDAIIKFLQALFSIILRTKVITQSLKKHNCGNL